MQDWKLQQGQRTTTAFILKYFFYLATGAFLIEGFFSDVLSMVVFDFTAKILQKKDKRKATTDGGDTALSCIYNR